MNIHIWHNPRCRKSREALNWLESEGAETSVFLYLKEDMSTERIETILSQLGMDPEAIMRKGEKEYKEFVKGKDLTREAMIQALVDYPKLIERPIVIKGEDAIIGRDLEKLSSFILK